MTESEVAVLISRLDSVKEQVEESKEEANKWREKFDEKIQAIQVAVARLPCPARAEIVNGLRIQVKWVWGVLVLVIGAIIADWVKR